MQSAIVCQAKNCNKLSRCLSFQSFATRPRQRVYYCRSFFNVIERQQQQQQQQQQQPRHLYQNSSDQDLQEEQQGEALGENMISPSSGVSGGGGGGGVSSNKPSRLNIKYNFARGHPNPSLLPVDEMQQILYQMSTTSSSSITKASLDGASTVAEDDNDYDGEGVHHKLQQSLNYLKTDQGDMQMIDLLSNFIDRHTKNDELSPVAPMAVNDDDDKKSTTESPQPPSSSLRYFMTHGVSHAIELLCRVYTRPNDIVLVERPTYFLATEIFLSHNLKVESLPMKKATTTSSGGGGGIDVDKLAQQFDECYKNNHSMLPRMIYIIPTHQNPTSRTMPLQDRNKLAEIAFKYNILIVADEVYHLLDWNDPPIRKRPARFAVIGKYQSSSSSSSLVSTPSASSSIERIGGCISINSFTKIFSPGVRCGWIEGPPDIVAKLANIGYIISQGCCVPFVGEIMRVALLNGWCDKVLHKLCKAYEERSKLLVSVLHTEPLIQIDTIPFGGYFVWITFTKSNSAAVVDEIYGNYYDASDVLNYCREHAQVNFLVGERCDSFSANEQEEKDNRSSHMLYTSELPADCCRYSARLCFADLDLNDIEVGTKKLVTAFQEYHEMKISSELKTLSPR